MQLPIFMLTMVTTITKGPQPHHGLQNNNTHGKGGVTPILPGISTRAVKDHQHFDLDQRSRSLPVI